MAGVDADRREFIRKSGTLLGSFVVLKSTGLLAQAGSGPNQQKGSEDEGEGGVCAAEDLMREHGVLSRILLIYGEIIDRLRGGKGFPLATLSASAGLVRRFIEDYHERLEEDFLFPRFEKAGKLLDLVKVLQEQHRMGRRLTDGILSVAADPRWKDPDKRSALTENMLLFIRMYRPHKAREDTVLFPALHSIVSSSEYDSLGDLFEDKERELFGEDGFESAVREVANLERSLGLYELSEFTPRIGALR